jgi:hypothetical protein
MASNDGKQLERFVSAVEEMLVPKGVDVSVSSKVFDDDGVQIAEFDIEISGKIGSVEMKWLIECRDRPSAGAAPGSWIEQLSGRRRLHRFNKVTAVSTTGFSPSAHHAAERLDIELRELKSADAKDLSWLLREKLPLVQEACTLIHIEVFLPDEIALEEREALLAQKFNVNTLDPIFVSEAGHRMSGPDIYIQTLLQNPSLTGGITTGGEPQTVNVITEFEKSDPVYLEVGGRRYPIKSLGLQGTVRRQVDEVDFEAFTYGGIEAKEPIAEIAKLSFEDVKGVPITLEFHKLHQSDSINVIARAKDKG